MLCPAPSQLPDIQSAAENEFILSNLVLETLRVWTGLTDRVTEGTFVWDNNAPVTYVNWGGGEPLVTGAEDLDCVYVEGWSGSWRTHDCSVGLQIGIAGARSDGGVVCKQG